MEIGDLICDWQAPSAKLDLPRNTVHIWSVTQQQAAECMADLRETLAPDERAKSGRIIFPKDRDGYVAMRGVLRDILGRYAHQPPADLALSYGLYGKPHLMLPGDPPLTFNSSRSGDHGLVAVARSHAVGIDLEMIKPCVDYEAIARNFFSPKEVFSLLAVPPSLQLHTFLKFWTRKEALSKGLGTGLGLDWSSIDVSNAPAQRVRVATNGGSKWWVSSFIPAPGFMGALAFEGTSPTIRFWEWPGMAFSTFPARPRNRGSMFVEGSISPILSKEVTG